MPRDVAVILTTYNRPRLVANAIASVLAQDCERWRLYVMDDGCDEVSRGAIRAMLPLFTAYGYAGGGKCLSHEQEGVYWWQGPQRSITDRKASISYSKTINVALSCLLRDERYVCYLCDDDVLHPSSVRLRAAYLDEHSDVRVVYGRLRSVQFGADGSRNEWANSGPPEPLHADFPLPTGKRVRQPNGNSWRAYYDDAQLDPDTHREYVEEGFWRQRPMRYGVDGQCDHNQVMHCTSALRALLCGKRGDRFEYWPEDIRYGVGDAGFFRQLADWYTFYGVDCWACSKAYHAKSDGVCAEEVRE